MENKKFGQRDLFLFVNLALALLTWFGDCLYVRYGNQLWLKSVTSALFVILGAVNLVYLILNKEKSLKFPILMVTGLVFAMLGDVILEIHFIAGAALFAIGHVFYFVAYTVDERFKPTDLIYTACILVPAILLITLAPCFDFGGVLMEVVCVVYATVISFMVGKAIANFVRVRDKKHLIVMLGSILFFTSDLMLLFNVFTSLPYFGALCLATYYPAEILLAFSVFLHLGKGSGENAGTEADAAENETEQQ